MQNDKDHEVSPQGKPLKEVPSKEGMWGFLNIADEDLSNDHHLEGLFGAVLAHPKDPESPPSQCHVRTSSMACNARHLGMTRLAHLRLTIDIHEINIAVVSCEVHITVEVLFPIPSETRR